MGDRDRIRLSGRLQPSRCHSTEKLGPSPDLPSLSGESIPQPRVSARSIAQFVGRTGLARSRMAQLCLGRSPFQPQNALEAPRPRLLYGHSDALERRRCISRCLAQRRWFPRKRYGPLRQSHFSSDTADVTSRPAEHRGAMDGFTTLRVKHI